MPLRIKKVLIDVDVKHVLVVRNGWQQFVDRFNLFKIAFRPRMTARKHGEDHNLSLRQTLTQLCNDRLNAKCNIGRRVAATIIGANHDRHQLGRDAVHFPILKTPQNILRAVAAHSQV